MPNREDKDLTARVRSALAREQLLHPYDLKVQVVEGVAHLTGIVDVLAERVRAGEAAQNVPGVTGVNNGLTVCTDGGIDDQDVQTEVAEELGAHPRLDKIGVEVHGGVVRLMGSVETLADESRAIRTAATARGVREVYSSLKFVGTWPHDRATVANRVERAISSMPQLSSRKIAPVVDRGVVTLKGQVSGPEDMELAVEVTSGVEGVKAVKNELSVEPGVGSRVVTEIIDDLQADPYVREAPVSITVVDGEIRVEGEVKTQQQKRRIEKAVLEALKEHQREIVGVDNRLMIVPD